MIPDAARSDSRHGNTYHVSTAGVTKMGAVRDDRGRTTSGNSSAIDSPGALPQRHEGAYSRRVRTRSGLLVLAILSVAIPARALLIEKPDDLCSPDADPCVVRQPVEVSSFHPLDFGLRVVRIEGEGRFNGTLDLRCGRFETDVAGYWMDVAAPVLPYSENSSRIVRIEARRGCSGNAGWPCLTDFDCEEVEFGSCAGGDGEIRLVGDLYAITPLVDLRARGDVTLGGRIRASGAYPAGDGGVVLVESTAGSIDVSGVVSANAGLRAESFIPGHAGTIAFVAHDDIRLAERVRGIGGGGEISFHAGGDIDINASIVGHGNRRRNYDGDSVEMSAGGDIRIAAAPGRSSPLLNVRGGEAYIDDCLFTGSGGDAYLRAGGDLDIADGVRIVADSGRSSGDVLDHPTGGDWSLSAGRDVRFGAAMTARGRGPYGYGPQMKIAASRAVSLSAASSLILGSRYGPELTIESESLGPVSLDGLIDVGGGLHEDGELIGSGGDLDVRGGNVAVGATIENGGGYSGGSISFDVCRLHLMTGARIDGSLDAQTDSSGENQFRIGESMIADPGSVIAGKPDSENTIRYRDAAKPPLLNGSIDPAPTLVEDIALEGCPVCGNDEIDEGETCDDGNLASGDGCDAACQSEL